MKAALVDAVKSAARQVELANNALMQLIRAENDPLLNAVLDIFPDATVSPSYWSDKKITVSEYFYDLDGFKDGEFMGKLERLIDLTDDWVQETKDHAESLRRTYEFRYGDLEVRVIGYAKEDNPTCRKVKVGEEIKTVVEEKFEIICE